MVSFYSDLSQKYFRKGETLYSFEEFPDTFYILREGTVKVEVLFEVETLQK